MKINAVGELKFNVLLYTIKCLVVTATRTRLENSRGYFLG